MNLLQTWVKRLRGEPEDPAAPRPDSGPNDEAAEDEQRPDDALLRMGAIPDERRPDEDPSDTGRYDT